MQKFIIDNDVLFAQVIESLKQGKEVTIPVKGTSMLPFIRGERDLVILEPVEACTAESGPRRSVKADDIVLFRYCGRYILHRILWVKDGEAEIQGDGVVANHEHCSLDAVYGRVRTILKNGKEPVDPYSSASLRRLRLWNFLKPIRRYILGVARRLPWTKKYFIQ